MNTKTQRDEQTNAAATATLQKINAERRWRLLKASASYSADTATRGVLTITSGGTIVWRLDVPAGGGVIEDFTAVDGLQMPAPDDLIVSLSAGGAGVIGRVNIVAIAE